MILDPPDVVAGDVGVREWNRGKIQKNQSEREELEIIERMDSTEDGGKENGHGETKSQMDFEKMAQEGTPPVMKVFWFWGTEFVDVQKFLERLRRELIANGLEWRQGWMVRDFPRVGQSLSLPFRRPNWKSWSRGHLEPLYQDRAG